MKEEGKPVCRGVMHEIKTCVIVWKCEMHQWRVGMRGCRLMPMTHTPVCRWPTRMERVAERKGWVQRQQVVQVSGSGTGVAEDEDRLGVQRLPRDAAAIQQPEWMWHTAMIGSGRGDGGVREGQQCGQCGSVNTVLHSSVLKAGALPIYACWASWCPGHHQSSLCPLYRTQERGMTPLIAPPTPSSPSTAHQSGIARTVLMMDMMDKKRAC